MSDAPKQNANVARMPSKHAFKRLGECRTLQEAFETNELKSLIANAAPKFMDPDAMLRTWVQAANKQPLIYQAELRQVLGAFQSLAYLGLVPNTHLNHAHMIPFKTMRWNKETRKRDIPGVDLQIIIGYPGYIELGHRSDAILPPHSDVVYDERIEKFSYSYGSNAHLEHSGKPHSFVPTAEPQYAYCYVKLRGGGEQFEVMTWAEVMAIRNRSQAYRTALAAKEEAEKNGWRIPLTWTEAPWVRDVAEMAKKTPLRRLYKYLPKCPELRAAASLEESGDLGRRLDFGPVIDGTASPLEGGVPEMDTDEPPPAVDLGAAHADRREESGPRDDIPPHDGGESRALTRETKAKASKASAPPAPTFEAILIDAGGFQASETISDGAEFCRQLLAMWREADVNDQTALVEFNADAIDEARQIPAAAAILRELEDAPEEGATNSQTVFAPVEPPIERGKVWWPGWVRALKIDLDQVSGDKAAWLEAQREVIAKAPLASRVLAIQAIIARIERPAWLAEMMRAPAKGAAAKAAPPAGDDKPARSADERWVDHVIEDLDAITGAAAFESLVKSEAVRRVMARLRQDNPPLFDRADAAFLAKHQAMHPQDNRSPAEGEERAMISRKAQLSAFAAVLADDRRDLNTRHLQLLAIVCGVNGALSIGEVAHRLDLSASATSRAVDRLVAHKLIDRIECAEDRRVMEVSATLAGHELDRRVRKFLRAPATDEVAGMIVKIQAPLNDPSAPCLLYDQSRRPHWFMPIDELPSVVAGALRREGKVYWHISRDDDGVQKPMPDTTTTDPGDEEYYDDDPRDWDEEDGDDFDCHLRPDGQCGAAGSEMCDWECPNRNSELFAGSAAWRRKHGVEHA